MRRWQRSESQSHELREGRELARDLGGVRKVEIVGRKEVRERTRPRELLGGLSDVFEPDGIDRRIDLDRQELTLASRAGHLEETCLLVMADLAYKSALQGRAAGLAASGESFCVH